MRATAVLLILLQTGIAADTSEFDQAVDVEAGRLRAPAMRISSFAEYDLKSMTFAIEIEAEKDQMEKAQEFERKIRAQILPLLQEWCENSTGGQGTLLIEPKVTKFRIIGGGKRFWGGSIAGDSFIDMYLKLSDSVTNEPIANVRIYRNVNARSGAWTFGKTDKQLDDFIVDVIHQYLSINY